MRNVLVMAMKDLKLLSRDRFALFWILAFPLIFALFFGFIFADGSGGSAGALSVAIVDLDDTEGSREFITQLEENEALSLRDPPDEQEDWTVEAAADAVRAGRVVAYIAIPEGFGDAGGLAMFTSDPPELEVGIDPTRKAEEGYLQGMLMEAAFMRMQETFSDPASMQPDIAKLKEDVAQAEDLSPAEKTTLTFLFNSLDQFSAMMDEAMQDGEDGAGAEDEGPTFEPVVIKKAEIARQRAGGPLSAFEVSFPQAMIWGIMGCAAGFAITLVQEKTRGTWVRLRLGPHTRAHILASKGLACFIACVATIGVLMALGIAVMGVRVGSWPNLAIAIACSAACFTGIMMLISTLGRTEQAVAGAGWAALMPFAMLGGGMVPLIAMPGWMLAASNVSPVKWAIYSMEGAIWRDFTLAQMALPSAILLGIGVLAFVLGSIVLIRREG